MLGFLQSFWWFLVLIGVMILLHELGHYLVARLFDVHIEAFSFGFGPRLFGFKRGETDFKFCAFLLGGYVKMAGEQPGEIAGEAPEGHAMDPRAFPAKPRWQRLLIIFAGPAVNFVLAVGILTGLFMYEFQRPLNPTNPVIAGVNPKGAAAKAGLMEGDRVVRVDGKNDPTWFDDLVVKEIAGAGVPIDIWVERGTPAQRVNVTVTPDYDKDRGMGNAGWSPQAKVSIGGFCCGVDVAEKAGMREGDVFVSINGQPILSGSRLLSVVEQSKGSTVPVVYSRAGVQHETKVTPVFTNYEGSERWRMGIQLQEELPTELTKLSFPEAWSESVRQNKQSAMLFYKFIQGLIQQRMSAKNMDGPIGIARMSGQAAKLGPAKFFEFMAMVSLNLAVVNLLPIPLLDGGGILMLLIEMLMRRDMSMKMKEGIVKVGFAFLMMVVVFVIYNDISKILTRS